MTAPVDWQLGHLGAGITNCSADVDAVWNSVITNVTDVEIWYGTPITLAKKKDDIDEGEEIRIHDITTSLLNDKMKYQDFPMISIMLIHFISTLGSGNTAEFSVSLIQILSTALSILSGMVSLRWAQEGKGIDIRNIIRLI